MTRNPPAGGRKRPKIAPLLLFAALLLFTGGRGPAAEHRPAVLVLHSYHIGLGWTDSITRGIESVLNNSPLKPDIHYEYMDAKRVSDPGHFRNLHALYKHKYRNKTFDAIISSDDHAFRFLLKHHRELFPATPVVFCGVNYYRDDMLAGVRSYFTGVVESFSIRGTIDVALRIQPDARYVFAVTDGSITGQANKKLLMEIIPDYKGRLEFIFFDSMEMTAVQDRVGRLPDHSFVLWLTFTTDPAGHRYSLEEGCRLVSEHCAAPLYSFWDFILGNGAVGGLLASGFAHGEMAARMAERILGGEEAGHLPVIRESPNRYMFDYRQMKRYGLDIDRLPPDSILLNGPKSFYAVNKEWIWAMVGVIVGLTAIVFLLGANIHLRRKSERALKKSEERFRGLFNNAQVGLVRAEVDSGRILECNQKFAEMNGYPTREACIAECIAFHHYANPEDRAILIHWLKEIGYAENLEFEMVRGDGERFWGNISSRLSEDNCYAESVLTDVTHRKRAEAEKKELVAKLERSKKMEAVGLLAGGVAHDLNNILSGIVSYPDLLLMDATLTDKQRHAIETMQRSGLRAAAVVSDLLTLARGAATVRKTIDLNDVVADYLNSPEFRDVQNKHPHMTLTAALGDDLPPISGSVIHIRKSLMNLVLNAAEALDRAGAVTIATAHRVVETPIWNYDRVPPGEYVVLTVSDNGPGIDPKDLDRIFEPFYTKKVMGRSGSGLGLTVVWNTVKDHGGYLVLENAETGAGFHLFFPAQFDAVAETAAPTPAADIQGRGETILVVDDEAHQREIASEILASLGYRPTTAAGGEAAIRRVEEAPYDLIVLDMIMDPGMNGGQTFERIAAIRPGQRVVIASGFAETEDVRTIQKAGTGTFVKKPYTREKLGAAIRAELKRNPGLVSE